MTLNSVVCRGQITRPCLELQVCVSVAGVPRCGMEDWDSHVHGHMLGFSGFGGGGASKKSACLGLPQCGNPSPSWRLFVHCSLNYFWVPCHLSLSLSYLVSTHPPTCVRYCPLSEVSVRVFNSMPEKPLGGGTKRIPRAFAFLWAGCLVLVSDWPYFCLLGCHLWKWSGEIRSSLVYQSQLLPPSWGKHLKEIVTYKMFKMCL